MEEKVEMEEASKVQGMPAVGGSGQETRRFTLHLGSLIAQWTVLLACVIGIGLCYLKGPDLQPQWAYIKLNLSNVSMKHVDMKREEGPMNVWNRSIQIRCDGHYLFFLKGTIRLQPSNDSLMLRVKKSQDHQKEYLLDVLCTIRKPAVQQAMVSELRAQDEIRLEANQTASSQDLSLVLIMLTPHSYCSPKKS